MRFMRCFTIYITSRRQYDCGSLLVPAPTPTPNRISSVATVLEPSSLHPETWSPPLLTISTRCVIPAGHKEFLDDSWYTLQPGCQTSKIKRLSSRFIVMQAFTEDPEDSSQPRASLSSLPAVSDVPTSRTTPRSLGEGRHLRAVRFFYPISRICSKMSQRGRRLLRRRERRAYHEFVV
ncbi:hypothetical protein RU639_006832 [Aspergillus parasiticus]